MHHFTKMLVVIFAVCCISILQCISTRSAGSAKPGEHTRTEKNTPPQIIEKKRFVDLAQLREEEHQLISIPYKKRPEVIMPGDQLEITLYEKLPVSQEKRLEIKRVDDDGTILLYPLGRIALAGVTLSQARTVIEEKMEQVIVSPLCELSIVKKAYEPRAFVFGEAVKPGAFPLNGNERLLDILSSAGGTTPRAYKGSVKLVRLYKDSVGVMSINLNRLFQRGAVEGNLLMQDQDIVYIPTRLLTNVSEVLTVLADVVPWYYFMKNF